MFNKSLVVVAGVLGIVMLAAAPSSAAGATKVSLRGPGGVFYCQTAEPATFDDVSQAVGFVIFSQDSSRAVHAVISLNGAPPNTTFDVRLIQATQNAADCFTVDGIITTNREGNGTTNIVEPKLDGAIAAQVSVDTSAPFMCRNHVCSARYPTYRAADLYPLS